MRALRGKGDQGLQEELKQLDAFLADVQGRAFRMAMASLRERDDALDAVQEAMFKLVEKYRNKPAGEWAPLFYKILYSRITDIQRRRARSGKIFGTFFGRTAQGEEPAEELMSTFRDPAEPDPMRFGDDEKFGEALDQALAQLPGRQRQAFMLRAWEGLDVAQTASAMGCGEGSVKTHYSRARQFLQRTLADFVEPEVHAKHL
ncbi:MAG: RNA polymerase sigma factor [Pseudomonadales bacterium]|nr:RNA polymerase sigma factor [Pseudomonadales bacterium]